MNKIHFTLQGKGGVGKSYISALIAQYLKEKGNDMVCIDTDPVNATFSSYKAFNVTHIDLMDGSKINERHFDKIMEMIFNCSSDFIIDTGASSFIPLSNYLIQNQAIQMLHDAGKQVVIHPVITGGQALTDTLHGFDTLASQMIENVIMIVWLNEYFGDIILDGRTFEQMKAYQRHMDKIAGIIRIPRQTADTFGKDVETMLNAKLTFDEAIASAEFKLMAKQRLKMVKKNLVSQMDLVL